MNPVIDPEAMVVDCYLVHDEIASGGMATVHLGRALGPGGVTRTVAIKRLHARYAKDPEFAAMFLDEARLAARIRHPNVVAIFDVAAHDGELFMVMEYLHGEPLSQLIRASIQANRRVPPPIAVAIIADVLRGLHAAHEASDEKGAPLRLVHRDISPQNILVGADGTARLIDFGVAKAAGRSYTTQEGQIKGKIAYMPPEQLQGERVDRRADIYATGVVLWELLTAERLFVGSGESLDLARLLDPEIDPPSLRAPGVPAALDQVTLRALSPEREARYPSALTMAQALTATVKSASTAEVSAWMQVLAGERLLQRSRQIAEMESSPQSVPVKSGPIAASLGGMGDGAPAMLSSRGAPAGAPKEAHAAPEAPPPRPPMLSPTVLMDDKTMRSPSHLPPEPRARLASERERTLSDMPTELRVGAAAARRRGPRWAVFALLGVVCLGSGWLIMALLIERQASAPAPEAEATSAAEVPAEIPAEVSAPSHAAAPAEAPPPEPSAAAPQRAPAPAASAARAPRPRAPRRSSVACDPPFTIDAKGHKIYKRECF
jgi:eukaryotic-like serine/threonine-protein kinase